LENRRPRQARETQLIRRLEAEWQALARSRRLRERLRSWAAEDPRLAFADGVELVAAAQRRNVSSWAERDQVLAALLERAPDDVLAKRVALQVVLPGLKALIDRIRGWDLEERAARVVTAAVEVLAWCAAQPARTSPSFRVYVNTRRRVLRAAVRDRSEPVVFMDDLADVERTDDPREPSPGDQRLDELIDWICTRGQVCKDAARLVVLTRAGAVSVKELAAVEGVHPQTLRQRRLRAERRVRQSMAVAR